MPRRGQTDIKQFVKNAGHNTLISKIITALFIGVLGFGVYYPLISSGGSLSPSKELAVAGSISAFLASVLFIIVFMGLQVSTSIVSTRTADFLSPLPLTRKEVSNVIFMCLIRMFDIPLVSALVVSLTVYFLVGGSVFGGLICLISTIVTEIFALALTIGLARFFYSRVAAGGGKSNWKTLLRLFFMLLWILPTLGTYLIISFAENIVGVFAVVARGFSSYFQVLVLIYPFSFGFLASSATFLHEIGPLATALSIGASLGYVILAGYSLKWVMGAVGGIQSKGTGFGARATAKDTYIRSQASWLGILRKDLRVASRSPSYASLLLLPAIQTIVLAVSFSSLGETGFNTALGTFLGISLITLLVPPTTFSIEGLASAYSKSLPLRKRTLMFAKIALATLAYALSMATLFLATLFFGRDPYYVLVYGFMHAFSVIAAIILEVMILTKRFWKEGFALGNVYAGLLIFLVTILPGIVISWLPIVVGFTTYLLARSLVLPVFLSTTLIEFAAMISLLLAKTR